MNRTASGHTDDADGSLGEAQELAGELDQVLCRLNLSLRKADHWESAEAVHWARLDLGSLRARLSLAESWLRRAS